MTSELGPAKDKLGGYIGEFPALTLSTYPTANPNPTLAAKTAYALRGSGYDVHIENSSEDFRPYELTATYEYKASTSVTTRLEYRHDNANTQGAEVFAGGDGSPTRSNQDSVVLGGFLTF